MKQNKKVEGKLVQTLCCGAKRTVIFEVHLAGCLYETLTIKNIYYEKTKCD